MTGVADVLGDLGFQRREIRKVYFVSQLVQEAYAEVVAVEIGREIEQVNFLVKQRDEERYDNLADLTAQIARDADQARAYFAQNPL